MVSVVTLTWMMAGWWWCSLGAVVDTSKEAEATPSEVRTAVVVNQVVLEYMVKQLMDMVNTTHHQRPSLYSPEDDGDQGSAKQLTLVLDPQDAVSNLSKAVTHTFDQLQQVTGLMTHTLDRLLEVTEAINAVHNNDERTSTATMSPQSYVANDCPEPFFRVNSECFYVHQAHVLNWEVATSFCQRLGGDLAEPLTVELLVAVLHQRPDVTVKRFWIGASDCEAERQWKWTSGSPVDLQQDAWMPREPNNAHGGEHCLAMHTDVYPSLNDYGCKAKLHFVCELQMGS